MREDLLVILCRSPHEAARDSHLSPPLTLAQASAAYAAMLMDTEQTARNVALADVWLACPGAPGAALRGLVPHGTPFISQGADACGDRLADVFLRGFAAGYRRVAVIGVQTPDLPPAYIATAFDRMREDPDLAALGQSLDGGVYFVGLSRYRREVFDGIPWREPTAWLALRAAATRARIPLAILPRWQAIETFSDLRDSLAREGARNLLSLSEHGLLQPCGAI